jgi:hypothetical protein
MPCTARIASGGMIYHVLSRGVGKLRRSGDGHLTTVCRYVGGRSVGANLVKCSVDWPWTSAGQEHVAESLRVALTAPPVAHRPD